MKYILNINKDGFCLGSGISQRPNSFDPTIADASKYPSYATDKGNEWIIAWTKDNYENYIIGIYAKFNEEVSLQKIFAGGAEPYNYNMPDPLFKILGTIKYCKPEQSS